MFLPIGLLLKCNVGLCDLFVFIHSHMLQANCAEIIFTTVCQPWKLAFSHPLYAGTHVRVCVCARERERETGVGAVGRTSVITKQLEKMLQPAKQIEQIPDSTNHFRMSPVISYK